MESEILGNLQFFGPIFAIVWIVTLVSVLRKPQSYLNSFLFIGAALITVLFIAGCFGSDAAGYILLAGFVLVMLFLFLVPVLLVLNGIRMIRQESLCAAHLLSLGLGVFVGVGEIAAVIYVLGLSDIFGIGDISPFVLFIAFSVFYVSFLVLSFVIYSIFIQIMPHRKRFNYIIIHGCGLAGGERMTKLLRDRVDKAIELYKKSRRKPIIIPSGGQGADEKLSEAQAMKNYLLERGVPEDHILIEDRSATTRENLRYSKDLIDAREGKKRTALVSSNYHIYRCLRLAKETGLKCTGIGAHVAFYYWPSALIREFIAVFSTKRFLIWSIIGYLLFISPFLYMWFH